MAEWQRDHSLWRNMFHFSFGTIYPQPLQTDPEYLQIDFKEVVVMLRGFELPEGRADRVCGWHDHSTFTTLLRLRIIDYYREDNTEFLQRLDEDFKKENDNVLQFFRPPRGQPSYAGTLTIENQTGVNVAKIVFCFGENNSHKAGNGFLCIPDPAFPPLTTDLLFGLVYTPVESLTLVFRLFTLKL